MLTLSGVIFVIKLCRWVLSLSKIGEKDVLISCEQTINFTY